MIEVPAWHVILWMLTCLFGGATLGIAYAERRRARPFTRFTVGDQIKDTHIGTITVQLRLGWRFRVRIAIALLLFRLGAKIAPARIDVEHEPAH